MSQFIFVGFILFAVFYLYVVVFIVRDTIVDKLTNLYIYNDLNFVNREKQISGDWDSLNYGDFIKKRPIFFALLKEGLLILGLPFFAALFAVIVYGTVPALSKLDSLKNVNIMILTSGIYYIFATFGCVYHVIMFDKYKEKASMEKNLWEAKSIIYGKK